MRWPCNGELEIEFFGSVEVVEDTRQSVLQSHQFSLSRHTPGPDRVVIDSLIDLSLKVGAGIKFIAEPTQTACPLLKRQSASMLRVDLLPGLIRRPFGVDDEAITVEDEPANHGVRVLIALDSMLLLIQVLLQRHTQYCNAIVAERQRVKQARRTDRTNVNHGVPALMLFATGPPFLLGPSLGRTE